MKIGKRINQIEMSGDVESGDFKIKSSAKAFQILSSSLYQNKIRAVVRELSANAHDAHVINGNNSKSFEIKIPNALDNQFYLRDFGPGLSHNQIMTLYTTYFDSTKTESNDLIGGLGLGSKSPFSYTDSFTVTSIHKGEQRIYAAYIKEDGTPGISQLGDMITTSEPDGLSVGFPVKPEDYEEFNKEIIYTCKWFNPKPEIKGGRLDLDLPKPIVLENNIKVFSKKVIKDDYYYGKDINSIFMKMGQVIYPLDLSNLNLSDELSQFYNNINGDKVWIIEEPIGTFEISASRESLQYDKHTKSELINKLQSYYDRFKISVDKEIKKIEKKESPFIARAKTGKIYEAWGIENGITHKLFLKPASVLKHAKLMKVEYQRWRMTKFSINDIKTSLDTLKYSTAPVIILQDSKAFKQPLVKNISNGKEGYETESGMAYVIVPQDSSTISNPDYKKEVDAILDAMGQPYVRKTSEHANTLTQTKKVSITKSEVAAYPMVSSYNKAEKKILNVSDIAYYVPYDYISDRVDDNTIIRQKLQKFIDTVNSISAKCGQSSITGTIYGLNEKSVEKIKKDNPNARNIIELLKEKLVDPNFIKEVEAVKILPILSSWSTKDQFVQNIRDYKFLHSLKGIWSEIASAVEYDSSIGLIRDFYSDELPNTKINFSKISPDDVYKTVFNRNPMLVLAISSLTTELSKTKKLTDQIKQTIEHDFP